jgi:protein-tyrosine phosphatase
VGKYRETIDLATLGAYRVQAMLQLADKVEQPDIASLYVPVEDGEPLPVDKLRQGVDFVRAQKAEGKTVLVACGAGISRSVTFTMAVLKEEEGLSLIDALRAIQTVHPDALPHDKLVYSLCQYYGEATWPPQW